ncbi:hypothetical protein [Streptomyces aidingensis]|uniref:Secreted protein n=1 Tax=Streptomyces aidingensis TaxID=910347 RepID=A0A1I1E7F8_9ACTN|nr:hypothetical protein [Streptomyces aidingensis]SFB81268.1 hypothetical protein SAMN05421773_10189 [Streptomyces aidingensis]
MRGIRAVTWAAAAAAVVLPLAACSGDGDGDGDGKEAGGGKPSAEETAGGDGAGGEPADTAALDGLWAAETTGGGVLLQISGGTVSRFDGSELCLGAAAAAGGRTALTVRCAEAGAPDTGQATVAGDALTVHWEAAGEQRYTRVADATAGLGDIPLEELNLEGLEGLEGLDPDSLDAELLEQLQQLEGLDPGQPGG